ncbi:MAG TPA: glycosyltransferase [Acidimicrobiales bacterium]|nr:glycosyltransferase [Acidimicrobiales bacterium]
MTPLATLVVVAYHRPAELRALLDATSHPAIEQVVVDVEADAEIAQVARGAGATLVVLAGNPGYAAAVNAGARVAAAETIVFSNDDISASSAAVIALARWSADADVVAVPKVRDQGGRPVRTVQAAFSLWSLVREWVLVPDAPVPFVARRVAIEKWREPVGPETVQAASAIVVAAPRSLLLSQPLPEQYDMYFEEAEWFVQIGRRGAAVTYYPDVVVTHLGGRSVTSSAKQALLARNAVRCLRSLYGRRTAALGWPVVVAWHARLVAVAVVRRVISRGGGTAVAQDLLVARRAGLVAALRAWREIG